MATVYDYDLHDLGQSAFASIQERALIEQSLRDAPATASQAQATAVQPQSEERGPQRVMRRLLIGAAAVGAVGGILIVGCRVISGAKD